MKALDRFTPGRALAIAALLSGVNPKNLVLNVTAAADVAQAGLSGIDQAIVMIVFVLVASLGIITPVAVYLAMGDRSESVLAEWKTSALSQQRHGHVRFVPSLRVRARRQGDRRPGLT